MDGIGIDIGSSSIKVTKIIGSDNVNASVITHEGKIQQTLYNILAATSSDDHIITTGGEGRRLTALPSLVLPIAIENALQALELSPQAVVSIGGEELVVYTINNQKQVSHTFTGDKCASGTGEFFKQQLFRMDMTLSDVPQINEHATVHKLSSRCSVFMKSDCTHKLNKNEATKDDIVLSLSNVMAGKVIEFLKRAKVHAGQVLLIGGASQNKHLVSLLSQQLPDINFLVHDYAPYFESFGAAIAASKQGKPAIEPYFSSNTSSFDRLPPLQEAKDLVDFVESKRGNIDSTSTYILGVDGGSTTTKVSLIDTKTKRICAAHYGRTHGNPIEACRKCLIELKAQIINAIGDQPIKISHVATTGSSREILGVFLQTNAVYNEIIAHTVGTTHFNTEIDTIFEIGGQDAKYVYLKNNVPIDYAMNEACSAGTGSFLEESASGDLNINTAPEIGPIAITSQQPLKFGEHCSAFINSDIRKAIQEGASQSDIIAGIVYSVVSNYLNRVVGNRSIGSTIVLQGGVAKNPAVPMAFAKLLNKHIVVPPDPELMGCFGVALLAAQKQEDGVLTTNTYDLDAMIAAHIEYGKEFRCKACDNDCPIKTILVDGKKYFFGGRCSKYALSSKRNSEHEEKAVDYIEQRNQMLFKTYAAPYEKLETPKYTIAVPLAFTMHEFWPLISWYFYELNIKAILINKPEEEGIQRCEAPFCYPGEIAHGTIEATIRQQETFDYIFLPHMKRFQSWENDVHACLCPIIQGLPYYAKQAFPDIEKEKILEPVIDLNQGWLEGYKSFAAIAATLNISTHISNNAFKTGILKQQQFWKHARSIGEEVLLRAKQNDETIILVQGRPYNAYSDVANMGIPRKFSSRNFSVLPMDFLPFDDYDSSPNMYWYYGQMNMKAARLCKENSNLYSCYISNFSCAPDSFILHQVRWAMGNKPYLILELDSHSADAGIDTRIEAFLDIIEGYRKKLGELTEKPFNRKYKLIFNGAKTHILDTESNQKIKLTDNRVKIMVPSMGHFSSQMLAHVLKANGMHSINLPVADINTTQLARNVSSGKECIPTLLVLGTTMQYFMRNTINEDEVYLVVAPKTTGPCRTGQYGPFFERVFDDLNLHNVVVMDFSSDNSYNELGPNFSKMAWGALIIADLITDARHALSILANNKEQIPDVIETCQQKLMKATEHGFDAMIKEAKSIAQYLQTIPKTGTVDDLKKVLVVGEIFVRRDDFSQNQLVALLAEKRILAKLANVIEWVHYTDYVREIHLRDAIKHTPIALRYLSKPWYQLQYMHIEKWWKHNVESQLTGWFKPTGLIPHAPSDINRIMIHSEQFAKTHLESEATLSSCVAAEAMNTGWDGIVAIAPFACLIGRLIKAFMTPYMRDSNYPFIAIENDGQKYPLNIINQLEMFMLNVQRFKERQQVHATAEDTSIATSHHDFSIQDISIDTDSVTNTNSTMK